MMKNPSQLLKFTQMCMRLATQQLPLYSSRFSKHTFTQPQLVVLYGLKLKLGVPYRELIDWRVKLPIRSLQVTRLIDTGAQMVWDLQVTATRKHDTRIAPG